MKPVLSAFVLASLLLAGRAAAQANSNPLLPAPAVEELRETDQAGDPQMAKYGPEADVVKTETQAAMAGLVAYFDRLALPRPPVPLSGDAYETHRRDVRAKLMRSAGLDPLPERPPLDVHMSEALDHPWATVRRVHYQTWPGVYNHGFLYMPKAFEETPAPAMLCPHGHWDGGNCHPDVQRRCLALAKMGYVVFSPWQAHHEELNTGFSHQTLMIWNNMRALDYLQSLPETDPERIGCAGASGGGLQTMMLTALDDRVKAATMAGIVCTTREIFFPTLAHCGCNHWPGYLSFTAWPEISTLALPTPVQYLTMNDWTKYFARDDLPAIQALYEANGAGGRVDHAYWPTDHLYDRPKRERTYYWMEKWLRNRETPVEGTEPEDIQVFEVDILKGLSVEGLQDKGVRHIPQLIRETESYDRPVIDTPAQWQACAETMRTALEPLLGAPMTRRADAATAVGSWQSDGLLVQRVRFASEGPVVIPALILKPASAAEGLSVIVRVAREGKEALFASQGPQSPAALAREGNIVVLPDVRFTAAMGIGEAFGEAAPGLDPFEAAYPLAYDKDRHDPSILECTWERNAVSFGRPAAAMVRTDLRAVLDGIAELGYDAAEVRLTATGSKVCAVGALFAAVLDPRIASLDADFGGWCFALEQPPIVPFILRHGDILEWAATLADREITLRGVHEKAGEKDWLEDVFANAGQGGSVAFTASRQPDHD